MAIRFLHIFFFMSLASMLGAQKDTSVRRVIHIQKPGLHCDCGEAKILVLRDSLHERFKAEKRGFGRQEFQPGKTQAGIDASEHHSVWYKLAIRKRGILTFRLTPHNTNDDYDFMLFKRSDDNSCMAIWKRQLQPVRGNLATNDTLPQTGMAYLALNDMPHLKKTSGDPFSMGLDVRPGEEYLLVIDNVNNADFEFDALFRIEPMVRYNVRLVNEKRERAKVNMSFQPRRGAHVTRGNGAFVNAVYGYAHQTAGILYYIAGTLLQPPCYMPRVIYFDSLYPTFPDTLQLETLRPGVVYPVGPLVFKPDHSIDREMCDELLYYYSQLSVSNPKLNMVLICNSAAGGNRQETEAVYRHILLKGYGVTGKKISWREEAVPGLKTGICVIFEKQHP